MTKKEKIAKIIYEAFDYVYCENCRFAPIDRDAAIEKFGYYACENCYRKYMKWEVSESFSEEIAEKILKELN